MNADERPIQPRNSATDAAAGSHVVTRAHGRIKKSARRGGLYYSFALFLPYGPRIQSEAFGGRWNMDARFVAGAMSGLCFRILGTAAVGLMGVGAKALAQNYPSGPYMSPPPGYRAAPVVPDDDDDLAPLPPPGAYGRPPAANPYDQQPRPPGGIQREALPAPGAVPATPYGGGYGGGGYADAPPPARRLQLWPVGAGASARRTLCSGGSGAAAGSRRSAGRLRHAPSA